MPNILATLALLLWPLISALFFLRMPVGRAVIATILLGYLFLPPPPAGYDPPLLPPVTKENIPALVAFVLVLLTNARKFTLPKSGFAKLLIAIYILGPVGTILTNPEPVVYDSFVLPGLVLTEAIGIAIDHSVLIFIFLMGRAFLSDAQGQRDLMLAFMVAGLVYAIPMLIEIRLSPQINVWIYGYFQHDFIQMMRGSGFRPIVFLYHGLWVALFTVMALASAATLARHALPKVRTKLRLITGFLFVLLVMCKSAAALLYSLLLVPMIFLAPKRMQILLALTLGLLACGYPILRETPLFPREQILELATAASPDRAQSLEYRLDNEDILMDRMREKPLLGWGLWGRNLLLDGETGRIQSVPDGRWIIILGMFGWLGFLTEFGLVLLPVWMIWRQSKAASLPAASATMCMLLGVNLVDMILNATITPLTWMIAGSLVGVAEKLASGTLDTDTAPEVIAPPPRRTIL